MPSEPSIYSDAVGFDLPPSGHGLDLSMTSGHAHRPGSALDHSEHKLRWGQRPKSTPISAGPRQGHSGKMSRPKTAAVILGRTECERVHQLEHEATRRHNLDNHLPLKRTKPPPWQKHLDTPLVPFVSGPGYVMSRSKAKCQVTIRDEFFEPTFEESRARVHGDPERDNLIAQLQQQISDLTLYLEEERLNHRQTRQKAEEFLRDKVEQMTSQHQDHIRDLQADHKDEMHKQKLQLEEEFKEMQATMEKQINRMAKEIEFLQGAFESYKSTLHTETADKWKAMEEELRVKYADEKQQALHDLRSKFQHERSQERANLTKEHQKAMETLRKENKREMDSLIRKFSNAASDIERLKKTTEELEETQKDLAQVKESYEETCKQLTNTTRLLTDTKVRLMEFEERFQEKVAQVEDKYRHKLQELMTQNTELKRLFVQKCGELFDEKTHTDQQVTERVKTAKEAMESLIRSKQRANVSIALGGPLEKLRGAKSRPVSAPGTRSERESAHITAGETEPPTHREFIPPDITIDSNPRTEEMRAELFSEPIRKVTKEDLMNSLNEL